MSKEQFVPPTEFQKTVLAIRSGAIVIGQCLQADKIRTSAEHALAPHEASKRLNSFEWLVSSAGQIQGEIGNNEVVFDLKARLHSRLPLIRSHNFFSNLSSSIINLCINDSWNTPAAIILPSGRGHSASVLVGDRVNVKDDLNEVELITELLRDQADLLDIGEYDAALGRFISGLSQPE